MPKTKTLSPSQELRSQIATVEAEVAELETTIARLDAEDQATAAGLELAPVEGAGLFWQISQAIDRAKHEESQEAAAKMRDELRQQCLSLLPQKQIQLEQLRDRLIEADSRQGLEPEVERIRALMDRYNSLAAELLAVGKEVQSASRANLTEIAARNDWNVSVRGCPMRLSIEGSPIAPEFKAVPIY